jgi:hypothetical protein
MILHHGTAPDTRMADIIATEINLKRYFVAPFGRR